MYLLASSDGPYVTRAFAVVDDGHLRRDTTTLICLDAQFLQPGAEVWIAGRFKGDVYSCVSLVHYLQIFRSNLDQCRGVFPGLTIVEAGDVAEWGASGDAAATLGVEWASPSSSPTVHEPISEVEYDAMASAIDRLVLVDGAAPEGMDTAAEGAPGTRTPPQRLSSPQMSSQHGYSTTSKVESHHYLLSNGSIGQTFGDDEPMLPGAETWSPGAEKVTVVRALDPIQVQGMVKVDRGENLRQC